jgi:nucleotide-binding universal stress UspA family protein
MKSILAAHDLSPRADQALERACQLAEQHGARLAVLHVVDQELPADLREMLGRQARALIERRLGGRGAAQVLVDEGLDFDAIARRSEELDADIVVMGPPRPQMMADMFVGTTVERVVRSSQRPALVVKHPADRRYAHLVVGVDLSDVSAAAVRCAAALFPEASIRALHALDLPAGSAAGAAAQDMREAEAEIDAFLSAFGLASMVSQRSALIGTPALCLERAASQDGADLVVVGTAGRGGVWRALIGSTSQAVVRSAPVDVLAVHGSTGNR